MDALRTLSDLSRVALGVLSDISQDALRTPLSGRFLRMLSVLFGMGGLLAMLLVVRATSNISLGDKDCLLVVLTFICTQYW